MNLAVDARMLHASGIGVYLQNLLPRMVAAKPEWRFVVLGKPSEISALWKKQPANVQVVPFEAGIYSVKQQVVFPLRAVWACDALWVPHYDLPLVWPLLGRKTFVTVHDVAHIALPEIFPGLAKQLYAKAMLQAVRWLAKGVVFVSAFSKAEFVRLVGKPLGPAQVVHNGVDEIWFDEPKPKGGKVPYVVYVGNVKPHKNLVRLLEAWGKLDGCPHVLKIVGKREGFLTGDARVAALAEKLGKRVEFTGRVEDETLRQIVAGASLLVMPSLYEGFGLPPLEAMACGVPCVVSNAASLPEVCGNAALYFNPHDAKAMADVIGKVLKDAKTSANLVAEGAKQARRFGWDDAARKTLKVLGGKR